MEIELPDGRVLEFPEGTDRAVALAAARRYLQKPQGSPQEPSGAAGTPPAGGGPAPQAASAPEPSWNQALAGAGPAGMLLSIAANKRAREGIAAGAKESGVSAYKGVKGLFTDITPEDRKQLEELQAEKEKYGGWGTLGGLSADAARNIAESAAVPEVKAMQVFGKVAPYLKAALGSGADAAATTVTKDNTLTERGIEAVKAAAAGVGLTGAGQAVKKGATGLFQATKDAIDLFKQGVNPTLQQAADSRIGRFIGGLTSGFTDVRRRQEAEMLDAITSRASGAGVAAPEGTVRERVGQLAAAEAADRANLMRGKMFPITGQLRQEVRDAGDLTKSGGRFGQEAERATDVIENIIGDETRTTRVGNATFQKDYIDPFNVQIGSVTNPRVAEALTKARDILEKKARRVSLTRAEEAQLNDLNARLYDIDRLRGAAPGMKEEQTGVNIKALADEYASNPASRGTNTTQEELVGPAVRVIGATPRQDEARSALVNAKRLLAGGAAGLGVASPATGAITGPLYGLSMLGQTGRGAKFLTGNYGWQEDLAKNLESPITGRGTDSLTMANLLRVLRDNPYALGSAATSGQ